MMLSRRAALLGATLTTACSPLRVLDATVPQGDLRRRTAAYGPGSRQQLDIYEPAAARGPLVVFFYGGGWRSGARADYRFVAEAFCAQGARVIIPDYRLFPEVGFPGFVEDGAAALAWAQRQDAGPVFVAGHSAGAHIALMLALNPAYLAAAGGDRGRLAGAIGLSGPYDFDPAAYRRTRAIFSGASDQRQTQPITFVDAGAPPLLLATGTDDTTVEPRNTLSLAARVAEAGGQAQTRLYPGVGHVGTILAMMPLFRGTAPVVADVTAFIGAGRPA
ncbi:alpha/beta hydrolase [Humitalea sp. 24SJ18S-53]|uniref:alpha/beta hydrolase n=1 Tax=Humitalea sp. 24SJ18S-53 TaxID=3422307 RepID=UPI003D6650D4